MMVIKLTLFLLLISITLYAQKLPNKQEVSLRAPSTIKIDGRATEWGQFQAYNKATDVFYTLSNDEDNLYLIIQATKPDIVEKLVYGGVTLTIKGLNKKDDKEEVAITFPKYEGGDSYHVNLKNKPENTPDSTRNKMQMDSFVTAKNNQFDTKFKLIEVLGVKDVGPVISVYNDVNIKTAARLDSHLYCTCEMAIPLKYLRAFINDGVSFRYNIKLNGGANNHATMGLSALGTNILIYDATGKPETGIPMRYASSAASMGVSFPTDFTGEYILAKK